MFKIYTLNLPTAYQGDQYDRFANVGVSNRSHYYGPSHWTTWNRVEG
ncbi:hypothetical protein [Acinetobacter wanghuae]|uniref:Uncharacterized protein n=1 Tax=Acinetobacter wanghuae TaxID=2662362 RepID=A0AA90W6Y1_9GAMM|nr:hypothetical protein [Acinetobacter wanghuae]MQW92479.1 hypothetical protein [Acinetobacter wanghuae]